MDKFSIIVSGEGTAARPCRVSLHKNNCCLAVLTTSRHSDAPKAFHELAKYLEACCAIIGTLPKFADTGEPITPDC